MQRTPTKDEGIRISAFWLQADSQMSSREKEAGQNADHRAQQWDGMSGIRPSACISFLASELQKDFTEWNRSHHTIFGVLAEAVSYCYRITDRVERMNHPYIQWKLVYVNRYIFKLPELMRNDCGVNVIGSFQTPLVQAGFEHLAVVFTERCPKFELHVLVSYIGKCHSGRIKVTDVSNSWS